VLAPRAPPPRPPPTDDNLRDCPISSAQRPPDSAVSAEHPKTQIHAPDLSDSEISNPEAANAQP
jgi:hypothetical protein